jgi:hypothetical protein
VYFCKRDLGDGVFELYHMNSGDCIGPENNGNNNGEKLKLVACGYSKNKLRFENKGIKMVSTGKCWHPSGGYVVPAMQDSVQIVVYRGCDERRLDFAFVEKTTIPN